MISCFWTDDDGVLRRIGSVVDVVVVGCAMWCFDGRSRPVGVLVGHL